MSHEEMLLEIGVIEPRAAGFFSRSFFPADEPTVEWHALTVALLDEIAPLVRARLGKTRAELPLASIREGGAWAVRVAFAPFTPVT
jgi:hypothetical protein